MNPRLPFIAFIATMMPLHSQEADKEVVPKQELVEYKEYLGLLGEEYCGNVFVLTQKEPLAASPDSGW